MKAQTPTHFQCMYRWNPQLVATGEFRIIDKLKLYSTNQWTWKSKEWAHHAGLTLHIKHKIAENIPAASGSVKGALVETSACLINTECSDQISSEDISLPESESEDGKHKQIRRSFSCRTYFISISLWFKTNFLKTAGRFGKWVPTVMFPFGI